MSIVKETIEQDKSVPDTSHLVDPSELINRRSAARLCGVTHYTILAYAQRGLIRSILIDGREYYFRSEVLTLSPQAGPARPHIGEETALAAVLEVAEAFGRLPSKIEYRQAGAQYLHILVDYYGSWKKVCEAARKKGEPFWKEVLCRQCRKTFAARISQDKQTTETCSYVCQKNYKCGQAPGVVFEGERFQMQSDGYYRSTRGSRMLQHAVWAFHYGRIPKTHRLCFIDGDKTNCQIENLFLKKIRPNPPCAEPGCPNKGWGERHWCKTHYLQRNSI
jgi:hypothetical protein